MSISLTTQIKWVENQIDHMEKTFPGAIAEHRMSLSKCTGKIDAARATLVTLMTVRDLLRYEVPK